VRCNQYIMLTTKKININLREQIILFKQLGFFLKSGASLDECLRLANASLPPKNRMRRFLEAITADMATGLPLAYSLEQHTNSLPSGIVAVISAGEESGNLRTALERAGNELVKKDASRKKLIGALTYPCCIALLSIALTGGMTFGIFPKIRPLLTSMHTALPLPTRVLIFVSDTVVHHWLIVSSSSIGFIGISIFCSKLTLTREVIANRGGQMLLWLPLVGNTLKSHVLSVFTGTTATLILAGLSLPISLRRARPGNITYARSLEKVRGDIEGGGKFSAALARNPRLFPQTMIQLISAAEASASLAETLSFLSEYFQNEYEDAVKKWMSLLEPALMIGMGISVGFISLAMILPIYAISQSVSAIH